MANSAKAKGDRAELEAVRYLTEAMPHLCLPKSQRLLGAGRAEDVGDLHVLPDAAIQVRNYAMSAIGAALRSAAYDSVVQAANGDREHALGMVPYPRARAGTVRWLAAVVEGRWPGGLASTGTSTGTSTGAGLFDVPLDFAMVGRALAWVRDDDGPHGYLAYPRSLRIARLAPGPSGGEPVLIAPMEAWMSAYRALRAADDLADALSAHGPAPDAPLASAASSTAISTAISTAGPVTVG